MPFDGRLLWYYTQATSVSRYFHVNALGSLGLATDQTGAPVEEMLYYPFGVRWQNSTGFGWDEKFAQFPQRDEDIQMYEARHREYNPGLGRWMTPDQWGGDLTNPQSLNRYAYVLNNPTTLADPQGLDPCGPGDNSDAYCVNVTAMPSNWDWIYLFADYFLAGWPTATSPTLSIGGAGGGGATATSPPKVSGNPCQGGKKGISPAQGQQILNASHQFFGLTYKQQDCSLFVCDSINASNVLPYKINRVTAQPSHVSIARSQDFKPVPSSTPQPADVMVFSNPNPYHMGFYVPKPPMPPAINPQETFLSATEHKANGGLGGPRYLRPVRSNFAGSITYYRLQEPCHE